MTHNVLFFSHRSSKCGVYEFGKNVFEVLKRSNKFKFQWTEVSSLEEVQAAISRESPAVAIYNYYPSVMPWLTTKLAPRLYRNNISDMPVLQIGIIHEVTQAVADSAIAYRNLFVAGGERRLASSIFDYYIAPDPTLRLLNPLVYKTGRLIPRYRNNFPVPEILTVGSYGFGMPNKGFERIVNVVQQASDNALIRFHIPPADYGDRDGVSARRIADKCREINFKPGIRLTVTHDYMSNEAVLDFLAQNTVNVFLYEDCGGRGISSALDNALAVQRPVAISDASMFRHLMNVEPSVRISQNALTTIVKNGFAPLSKYYEAWGPDNLLWEYERILTGVLARGRCEPLVEGSRLRKLHFNLNRVLSKPNRHFSWLRDSDTPVGDEVLPSTSVQYSPLEGEIPLNRILDDSARALYAATIAKLAELAPKTIAKKIPEANVQQAFVLDAVCRYAKGRSNSKVLCVGSYEDTAAISLRKLGIKLEEIDPVLNYSLQEYFTKPTTVENSYDIIFSTSVIEHDPDDGAFVKCVDALLAPGGVAILTCDYLDGWRSGDPKPECNLRFYTKHDLQVRLLAAMPNCSLVDVPNWDCVSPDFSYLNKYRYTFATFVVKKLPCGGRNSRLFLDVPDLFVLGRS
ncbi:MAG: hypothetical protein FD154_1100 [Elusimicrobia bacterium]|nr:MAG: hypothetical protein FD154_1100 [Elusimicrobiota bacterium]